MKWRVSGRGSLLKTEYRLHAETSAKLGVKRVRVDNEITEKWAKLARGR